MGELFKADFGKKSWKKVKDEEQPELLQKEINKNEFQSRLEKKGQKKNIISKKEIKEIVEKIFLIVDKIAILPITPFSYKQSLDLVREYTDIQILLLLSKIEDSDLLKKPSFYKALADEFVRRWTRKTEEKYKDK